MKISRKAFMPVMAGLGLALSLAATPALAEDVTYLLPAPSSLPAFGPWMVAQQRGYFKAENLNVTFQVARGGVDVAKQVGAGNAVVGGAIGDTPILVRANGVPVKAVAVLGGRALMQLVVNKDKGINSVKDLKGKVVTTMAYQDTTFFALLGMLATQGMTKDDVNAQAVGPVNVWKLFAAGEASVKAVPENAGKEAEIGEIFKGYAELVYPGQKVLGEMDEARLSELQDFYMKEGIIQQKTAVKDLYTNQFVQ